MTITRQQIQTGGANGATSGNVTLATGPTAGNLLVCILGSGQIQDDPELSGWTTAVQEGGRMSIFVKIATSADNTTPSWGWAFASSDQVGWICAEYSASGGWPAIASVIDVTASTASSSTAGPKSTGTTATSSQAEALVVGGIHLRGVASTAHSWTNSFTEIAMADYGSGVSQIQDMYAEKIVSATAAYETSMSWTGGTASYTRGVIAVLLPDVAISVTPGLAQQLAVAFAPTITTGAVNVAPGLLQQLAAAFASTITTGSVSVTPGLAQQLVVAFDPEVSRGLSVLSNLAQQLVTAFAPTFSTGPISFSPGLAQQLTQAYSPTLLSVIDMAPGLVQQLATAFDPTVVALLQKINATLAQQLAIASDLAVFRAGDEPVVLGLLYMINATEPDTYVKGLASETFVEKANLDTTVRSY